MSANQQMDLFEARLGQGLRELDGHEQAPDVSAVVVRRLAEEEPAVRRPRPSWLAIVAALLAIAVTSTLLVQNIVKNGARGGSGASLAVESQDPESQGQVGQKRLVYELPVDELQRSLRDNRETTVEELLQRTVRGVEARLGSRAVVTRSAALTFTVDLAEATPEAVLLVRAIVESTARFEMRMLADGDYAKAGVTFDMPAERKQLQAWLADGNGALIQHDPGAITKYRARSEHLRWYAHRVWPSAARPGTWDVRYANLSLGVVAVHAEADWKEDRIPAHILAKPAAEQFLVELFPVNLHEIHFSGADLDPTSITVQVDQNDGVGTRVYYRMLGNRTMAYADFTEKHIGHFCAMIWDDEVLSAPRFVSRIPGPGCILSRLSPQQAETIAAALRTPLPAIPRLVR